MPNRAILLVCVSATIVCCSKLSLALPCTSSSACSAVCNNTNYDLSSIFSKYPSVTYDKYEYQFRCSGQKCGSFNHSAVCQVEGTRDPLSCGSVNNVQWTLHEKQKQFLIIKYSNGQDGRNTKIEVLLGNTSSMAFDTENKNSYTFILTVKSTNELLPSSSGGGGIAPGIIGWVLIGIALIGFITYFIVGGVFMVVVKGARGIEIIPNVLFWKNFPFLLKDGFMLSIYPCLYLIRRKNYDRI